MLPLRAITTAVLELKAIQAVTVMRRFKSKSKTASLEKLRAAQVILDDTLNVDPSDYAKVWAQYVIAQAKLERKMRQPKAWGRNRGPSPYLPGWESAPGNAVAAPAQDLYKHQDPGDDGKVPW